MHYENRKFPIISLSTNTVTSLISVNGGTVYTHPLQSSPSITFQTNSYHTINGNAAPPTPRWRRWALPHPCACPDLPAAPPVLKNILWACLYAWFLATTHWNNDVKQKGPGVVEAQKGPGVFFEELKRFHCLCSSSAWCTLTFLDCDSWAKQWWYSGELCESTLACAVGQ